MRNATLLLLFLPLLATAQSTSDLQRWEQRAARVEIIRDDWGIPHIYAATDADAVFGMLYAQCEDDFPRVERNYLEATAQLATVLGEDYLYHDLRTRLFLDSLVAKQHYAAAPEWLQALCDAFADGVNYYLHTHPRVRAQAITHYRPWMPFMFSEGSIGGDQYWISTEGLENFYGEQRLGFTPPVEDPFAEPLGSNGFAISKRKAAEGKSLLLINPHTSHYFRTEQHMNSEEGLGAYGAVTWGQFFVYQGFNEHCGWMHTSTKADAIDLFRETVIERDGQYFYQYGSEQRPFRVDTVELFYKTPNGLQSRSFTTYHSHHGPVIYQQDGDWYTYAIMNRPVDALTQSYLRTKAKGYRDFRKTMKLCTNSSNNTVFADAKGNIAYWHGNFIPKKNPALDYQQPVDGSTPTADWQGYHKESDLIRLRNPKTGWLQNCNSTPFTAAADYSPRAEEYPFYMAPDRENYRGINAVRVLQRMPTFTLDSLVNAANDPYLAFFADAIPALADAYAVTGSRGNEKVASAYAQLSNWNYEYGLRSVPTSVAIPWAERLLNLASDRVSTEERRSMLPAQWMNLRTTDEEKVDALAATITTLEKDFGSWQTPWGVMNRFQRLSGAIEPTFSDLRPSIPVSFASARWGALASYGARTYPGTKKRYGRSGNSFVAVVQFGKRLRARAVVSGGQSGYPRSPHFRDQEKLFAQGRFRDVYFYPTDLAAHTEKRYSPGE
ncbi:MAG: penicillin acylase family protein [Bacteroidota bacterium]